MLTVPDVSPPPAQMYGGDDDLTSSSGSEVELETVKTADAHDNPFRGKSPVATVVFRLRSCRQENSLNFLKFDMIWNKFESQLGN